MLIKNMSNDDDIYRYICLYTKFFLFHCFSLFIFIIVFYTGNFLIIYLYLRLLPIRAPASAPRITSLV